MDRRLCLISGRRPRSRRVCAGEEKRRARKDETMTRRGCIAWMRTGKDTVITHIRTAPPEVLLVVVEEAGA
jgi:hypothetical protein